MIIREATRNDFERIMEIFREEYKKPPYNEDWTEEYAGKKLEYYFENNLVEVPVIGKDVAGFIITSSYYWHDGLRGSIDEIAVDSRCQFIGIGKKLLERAENRFKQSGISHVSLMAHTKSKAFQIYKKWGFENEDFVFMIKNLK